MVSTCSYGYDDNHKATDDPGVAIAADARGTSTTNFYQITMLQKDKTFFT